MFIDDENVKFGLLQGLYFRFLDGDNLIEASFFALSGKEEVRLNGQVVSEERSQKLKSVHTFHIADSVAYEIELLADNLFLKNLCCHLRKEGQLIRTYRLERAKSKSWLNISVFVLAVLVSIFLTKLGLAQLHIFLAIFSTFLITIWYQIRNWRYTVDP